jgi:UPF0716 family protein affecting phage T7 exclusion
MVTPGFFTDAVGLLLLFPVTRAPIRQQVINLLKARSAQWQVYHQQQDIPASKMEVIDSSSSPPDDDDETIH